MRAKLEGAPVDVYLPHEARVVPRKSTLRPLVAGARVRLDLLRLPGYTTPGITPLHILGRIGRTGARSELRRLPTHQASTPSASRRGAGVVDSAMTPRSRVLGVVLLATLGLRAWGLDYGLPHPLARPDEEQITQQALTIVSTGDLDPGKRNYPGLFK